MKLVKYNYQISITIHSPFRMYHSVITNVTISNFQEFVNLTASLLDFYEYHLVNRKFMSPMRKIMVMSVSNFDAC